MSTAKPEKVMYKNPDGEIFDPEGAIKRHPALATLDVVLEASPSGHLVFKLMASGSTMARLCQILNAAPVSGDPLRAIVDLDLDTTANEAEREALVDYLAAIGDASTLEHVAAAYLYEVTTGQPLELDVHLGTDTKEFAVTRITSRYDSARERLSHLGKCLSSINFKIPGGPKDAEPKGVTIVSEQRPISIEDLEGHALGDGWRIIHALKPGGNAPHGGFILEHIDKELINTAAAIVGDD